VYALPFQSGDDASVVDLDGGELVQDGPGRLLGAGNRVAAERAVVGDGSGEVQHVAGVVIAGVFDAGGGP